MGERRERFIQHRKSVGFSQESLAEAAGVERSTVGRWERGGGEPQPWQRPKLAALLKVSLDELDELLAPTSRPASALLDRLPTSSSPSTVPIQATARDADSVRAALSSPLADAAPGSASMVLMNGDVRVGCRTSDGRIIFVTMPRRALLRGVTAATGVRLLSRLAAPTAQASPPVLSADVHPVENMRLLRRSLVECDNVLGPRNVVGTAQEHVRLIQHLRGEATGRDRRDLLVVQAEYAEFCSWLYQDSGDHAAAQYWADRAVDWSSAAGDQDLTVYVMARKSQLAGDMKDSLDAVDLAESAQRLARPGSRLSAMSAVYGAHGHALLGDEMASQRAYEQALLLVSKPPDAEVGRGRWLDAAYVEAQQARSLSLLGRHHAAVIGFERAIGALPASYRRDRGVYLARSAVAQLHAGGPEQAAVTASEALSIATVTGSARIFGELAALDALLQPWRSVPEVADFQQSLDSVMLHEV